MHRLRAILCLAMAALSISVSCGAGSDISQVTQPPSAYSRSCPAGLTSDSVHFSIYSPRGEEVFRQGQRCTLRVCSADPEMYRLEDAEKRFSIDNGRKWNHIPEVQNAEGNEVYWTVPDSFFDDEKLENVSSVSDSCLIRISIYSTAGDPTIDYSEIKKPFKIASR